MTKPNPLEEKNILIREHVTKRFAIAFKGVQYYTLEREFRKCSSLSLSLSLVDISAEEDLHEIC